MLTRYNRKKLASFIGKIKTPSDTLVHETTAIVKEFRSFYQQLYHMYHTTVDRGTREALIQEYLAQANLPKLPTSALEALEGELTTSELRVVLKTMANGKAPGPDGLTIAYYHAFMDTLLPRLTSYANCL